MLTQQLVDSSLTDFVKAALGTAAATVGLVYLLPSKHIVFKRARLGLSENRLKRLDKLLEKDRWKAASSVELELAFDTAFGFSLNADMVRYVFSRQNVIEHVRLLKSCRLMVRLASDGTRLERSERAVRSFRRAALWSFALATVPFLTTLIGAPFAGEQHRALAATALGVLSVWAVFWGWMAGGFEAAHQVTIGAPLSFPRDDHEMSENLAAG